MMSSVGRAEFVATAAAIARAEHLLITAGTGMGADSGLRTFRGKEGFWNLYPPDRHLGLDSMQLAMPEVLVRDPELGWGFMGIG